MKAPPSRKKCARPCAARCRRPPSARPRCRSATVDAAAARRALEHDRIADALRPAPAPRPGWTAARCPASWARRPAPPARANGASGRTRGSAWAWVRRRRCRRLRRPRRIRRFRTGSHSRGRWPARPVRGRRPAAVHAQIAVGGFSPPSATGGVGLAHMGGIAVGVGIHRHAADAQALQGTDGADGDFASVGDQNGIEHVATPERIGGSADGDSGWPGRRASRHAP